VKQRGDEIPRNSDEIAIVLTSWPLHDCRRSEQTHAIRFSDGVATRAEKSRNGRYASVMRPSRVEHEMKLWLPARHDVVRGFFFVRTSRRQDFDERDRAVLTVLRSPLATIRERWERRRRPPGLTDRETEVLHALRDGLTNREIADRLVISAGTVRAHLENIFQKLGVHTRTAALARAFGTPPRRALLADDQEAPNSTSFVSTVPAVRPGAVW
jgi:DNA-binding CsgD family transcriptional regulator